MPHSLSWFVTRLLAWVTLSHALLFIIFWLTNALFYASTNDYLANKLAKRMDYVNLLLVISAFIAAWSFLVGILSVLRQAHLPAALLGVYAFIALVYILFFYASFALLFKESPVQVVRIRQLVGYFRLALDPVLLLGLALLAGYLVRNALLKMGPNKMSWLSLGLPLLVFTLLWGLAFAFPPSSVIRGKLPNKPLIIAHRGASMLAPENTLAAATLAVEKGAAGLETDIQVSKDGQLFLLHDNTFERTTNVASVFPGRERAPASDFTIDEIRQLNAGDWFVKLDPYRTIRDGLVTPQQVQADRQQSVPLLSDWVDILRRNRLVFIFDLKQLPEGNPYASQFFDLALQQLSQSDLSPLVWFLVDDQQIRTLQQLAPAIMAAYGTDYQAPPQASQLVEKGYGLVNVEYGLSPQWIERYHAAGLRVNLYTVDEPWQFSRLWLLGADSITTSNVGVMAALSRPVIYLPYGAYLLLWSVVGLIGLGILVGMIVPAMKIGGVL